MTDVRQTEPVSVELATQPRIGRTVRILEALGLVRDGTTEVPRRIKVAAWASAVVAAVTMGNAALERLQSDDPAALPHPTDVGSGVRETVPIVGQEDLDADKVVVVEAGKGDTIWTVVRDQPGRKTDIRTAVDYAVDENGGTADIDPGDDVAVLLEDR